ncbi:MAG: lamin tail domain-containing protein [Candidatus Woesearchaeota archaeon]
MKKVLIFFLFLALANSAEAGLLLTEVMYAPTQTPSQTDSEWIELYNDGDTAIDLAEWEVDGNSFDDVVLQPGQYIVLARELVDGTDTDTESFESYWGNNDGVWDSDDGFLAADGYFSLADSEDTINLSDGNSSEVFHYTSAIGGNENGKPIVRINYSLPNTADNWEEGRQDGTPGRGEGSSSGNELTVSATILDISPVIVSAHMSDVLPDDGTQAIPGENISLEVIVEDLNGADDLVAVTASILGMNYSLYLVNATNTTASFAASFELPSSLAAGTHTLTIAASDSSSTAFREIEFEYLSVLSTSILPSSITFQAIVPGNVTLPVGVTVVNDGNVAIQLEVEGTGLSAGNSTLPTSALEYNAIGEWKALATDAEPSGLEVGAGNSSELQFRINVPEATKAASYSGKVRIVARAV